MAFAEIKGNLVAASLARITRQAFDRFWANFVEFLTSNNLYQDMPFHATVISDFVTYLHLKNFEPSSVSSHLSAITYFHQVARFSDPCDDVIVKRMIPGSMLFAISFSTKNRVGKRTA
jgi:site-specific recombinase XerD